MTKYFKCKSPRLLRAAMKYLISSGFKGPVFQESWVGESNFRIVIYDNNDFNVYISHHEPDGLEKLDADALFNLKPQRNSISVKLSDNYIAEITKNGIKVNCQSCVLVPIINFDLSVVDELVKAKIEVLKS